MTAPTGTAPTDDWNRHWSEYAATAALNPAQAYRRMLIFRSLALDRAKSGVRMFEVGSGQGDLSRELVERHPGMELMGVDLSDTGVAIAKAKVPGGEFFQQDLLKPLAVPERYLGWATHAVCSEVLEHLDDPLAALRNARRCLAPGGKLVVTVPAGPMSAFDKHIGHRRHFTPGSLRTLLEEAGLRVTALSGAGFPFFNLYRLTVVARGKKLIEDASSERTLPFSARAAIQLFSVLFRLNRVETQLGWQLVATAEEPSRVTGSQAP
jgi:SAM-dependent methyltransferase